jgi:hypothetical protein
MYILQFRWPRDKSVWHWIVTVILFSEADNSRLSEVNKADFDFTNNSFDNQSFGSSKRFDHLARITIESRSQFNSNALEFHTRYWIVPRLFSVMNRDSGFTIDFRLDSYLFRDFSVRKLGFTADDFLSTELIPAQFGTFSPSKSQRRSIRWIHHSPHSPLLSTLSPAVRS